jgi:hypothetical protein
MSAKPTKVEADQLVEARKVISSPTTWTLDVKNTWRLEAKALAPTLKAVFRFVGYVGKRNHSFSLLYNNYPIRRYTKHHRHQFKDKIFTEAHKHIWDEYNEGRDAYIPKDINPNDDINEQFLAFCNECNIDLVGGYQSAIFVQGDR